MKREASRDQIISDAPADGADELRFTQSMVVPKGAESDAYPSGSDSSRALRAVPAPRAVRGEDVELFCPFESGVNPHADVVQSESVAWARRFGLIQNGLQSVKLEESRIARLEALVFRTAAQDALQLAANWTTLFCLLDDYVERDDWGPLRLSGYLARLLEALRAGQVLVDDPFSAAFADLRAGMFELGDPSFFARFVTQMESLFCGYVWEVVNRRKGLRPGLLAYREMRLDTIGLRPQFLLGELCERIHISEDLRRHPDLRWAEDCVSRAVGWANDISTCRKELRVGEVHNLVMVIMDCDRLPLAAATQVAAAAHDEEVRSLLAIESRLMKQFADPDGNLRRYVEMLQHWIRGHLDWAKETGRYNPP